ncbi:CcmD family protein [Daejeonella oryzae]|uniref:CcmD family protein n=1 Tax=Daejeonella oryzae TaxID=1122943 RepID=UPI00041AACF0|nr:CcmD family protein [Daejeonella oryzae]
MKKSVFLFLTIIVLAQTVLAQNSGAVEMADTMRDSGKIYVVVAVISIIFIGIVAYLFSIDKRVKKVEKGNG